MASTEKHMNKQNISSKEYKTDLEVPGETGLEQPRNHFRIILLHSPYAGEKVHSL